MNEVTVLEVGRDAMYVVLTTAGPLLLAALGVGQPVELGALQVLDRPRERVAPGGVDVDHLPVADHGHAGRVAIDQLPDEARGEEQPYHGIRGYLNRLSDYLFVMARYCNHITGTGERTWGG